MKRLLAALMLSTVLSVPTTARAAQMSFDPTEVTTRIGQEVTLQLNVDQIQGLRACRVVFSFDPSIVRPTRVDAGQLMTEAPCTFAMFTLGEPGADTLCVDAAGLGCNWNGTGELMLFHFVGVSDGTTQFTFIHGIMRDDQNHPIEVGWGNATINVISPTTATRTTWGRLKLLYR